MSALAFTITAQLADRRTMIVTAAIGDTITSERFPPGDGERRRRVAHLWAGDVRLWNGAAPNESAVVEALERAEADALAVAEARDDEPNSDSEVDADTDAVDADPAAPLPFTITARLSKRDLVVFSVTINDQIVTSEKYAPGDGKRRRETAALWCRNERLWGGKTPNVDGVLAALDAAEIEALVAVDSLESQATSPRTVIEAASYVDGGIIVELAWNTETAAPDFIICERSTGRLSRVVQLETARGLLVPPSACAAIVTPGAPIDGCILLPTECDDCGDEFDLRADLAAFINRYVELPGESVSIAVEYVFLSWIFDAFDEVPYLAIRTAGYGKGKSRALEAVGALCYRTMFIGGGSSAAATLRLIDLYGGTVVADEFDRVHDTELASDITKIMNQGFQRGRPLVKCDGEKNEPRAFRCFGPKLFALRKTLGDDATESRCISIRMQKRTRKIPLNLPREQFDREARALRNRLLAWRFANHGRIKINPDLADPELEDRLNQIGLPLLAVARDAGTRTRIVEALRDQQGSIRATSADSLPGEVFAAVLAIGKCGDKVRPGDVAAVVNKRRAAADGVTVEKLRKPISANKVGWVLKDDLELPRERDDKGSVYELRHDRVVQLGQQFGVKPETLQDCHHCNCKPDCHEKSGDPDSAKADSGNGGNDGKVSRDTPDGGETLPIEDAADDADREEFTV